MEYNRRERDEDVTVLSNPELILCDGHRVPASSCATTPIENPSIAAHLIKATLEEVATLVPRAKGDDTFDGLTDRPVSEVLPLRGFSSLRPAHQLCWRIQSAISLQVSRP